MIGAERVPDPAQANQNLPWDAPIWNWERSTVSVLLETTKYEIWELLGAELLRKLRIVPRDKTDGEQHPVSAVPEPTASLPFIDFSMSLRLIIVSSVLIFPANLVGSSFPTQFGHHA